MYEPVRSKPEINIIISVEFQVDKELLKRKFDSEENRGRK